ncbi:hypothetical protein AAVH_06993 [Aphelenchoides avenae]|nr:hypothetical protein AAVH_06993 [Aphelenchus avenae]
MRPTSLLCTVILVGLGFAACHEFNDEATEADSLVIVEAPPSQMIAVPRRTPPADGTCENARFKSCQQQFATNLKTPVENLKDSKRFRSVVARYYRQANLDDGLVFLCRQRQLLHGCLGAQYDACVDPWASMRRGQSPENAYETGQIYRQMEFDCDGGFIQVVSHWGCIKAVTQDPNYNTTYNNCWQQFNQTVKDDPTSYCTAAEVVATCLSSIFHTASCPGSNDLVWWMCERTRLVFQLDGFCPNLTCVVPPVSTSVRDAVEHRRYGSRAEAIANGAFVSQARRNFHHLVGIKNRLRREKSLA